MYPLLLLSLAAGAVIIERFIAFRRLGRLARGLLDEVMLLCNEGRFDLAEKACAKQEGPVAASLATILKHRGQDVQKVERFVEETGQAYFIRMERYLSVLDTTTTVSPLLGLLGTIVGMIGAFNSISMQSSGGSNDAVLHGVAEALYATASGITIAIICFIAYNYFSARIRHTLAETEMAATKLLNALSDLEQTSGSSALNSAPTSMKSREHHAV